MWGAVAALLGLAGAGLLALGGPRAGQRTVAVLSNEKPLNVVFDGVQWRPMGSADFETVKAWAESGAKMAEVNGVTLTWNGIGFA